MIPLIIFGTLFFYLIAIFVVIRILTRVNRAPSSRLAWIFVVLGFPVIGVIMYLFLGETHIGKKHLTRNSYFKQKLAGIPIPSLEITDIPKPYRKIFTLASSINNFPITGGNTGDLTKDNADALNTLIEDIGNAKKHVHVCFYIWLDDEGGLRVMDAVIAAQKRGVKCRVLVDAIGSKVLLRTDHWKKFKDAGVDANVIFGLKHILFLPSGRVDIRNHRKIAVIDSAISYVGSLNCCDGSFYTKPKYAPWVDILLKVQGNVVQENQKLFLLDWYMITGEDASGTLSDAPKIDSHTGFPAVVVGLGPTELADASNYIFEALFLQAKSQLIVTTPYFVPTGPLVSSLCSAARSGVEVVIMLPEKNDSFVVSAASKSYYLQMLESGVRIYHYTKGILHAKIVTVDQELTFLGSSNLDRRSFELNYENNMLLLDKETSKNIYARQQEYLQDCREILPEEVEKWDLTKQIWNNTIATIGPVL